jgi:hypothetical protein
VYVRGQTLLIFVPVDFTIWIVFLDDHDKIGIRNTKIL